MILTTTDYTLKTTLNVNNQPTEKYFTYNSLIVDPIDLKQIIDPLTQIV